MSAVAKKIDPFAAYNPDQHYSSVPFRRPATNVLIEDWKKSASGPQLQWPWSVRVRERRVTSLVWGKAVIVHRIMRRGILNDISEDKNVLLPTEGTVTVEDVEVRKEDAYFPAGEGPRLK